MSHQVLVASELLKRNFLMRRPDFHSCEEDLERDKSHFSVENSNHFSISDRIRQHIALEMSNPKDTREIEPDVQESISLLGKAEQKVHETMEKLLHYGVKSEPNAALSTAATPQISTTEMTSTTPPADIEVQRNLSEQHTLAENLVEEVEHLKQGITGLAEKGLGALKGLTSIHQGTPTTTAERVPAWTPTEETTTAADFPITEEVMPQEVQPLESREVPQRSFEDTLLAERRAGLPESEFMGYEAPKEEVTGGGILGLAKSAIGSALETVGMALGVVQETGSVAGQKVAEGAETVVEGTTNLASSAAQGASNLAASAVDTVSSTASTAATSAQQTYEGAKQGVSQTVERGKEGAREVSQEAAGRYELGKQEGAESADRGMQSAKETVQTIPQKASETAQSVSDTAGYTAGKAKEVVEQTRRESASRYELGKQEGRESADRGMETLKSVTTPTESGRVGALPEETSYGMALQPPRESVSLTGTVSERPSEFAGTPSPSTQSGFGIGSQPTSGFQPTSGYQSTTTPRGPGVMAGLKETASGIGGAVQGALAGTAQSIESMSETMLGAGQTIGQKASEMTGFAGHKAAQTYEGAKQTAAQIPSKAAETAKSAAGSISETTGKVVGAGQETGQVGKQKVGEAAESGKQQASATMEAGKQKLGQAAESGRQTLEQATQPSPKGQGGITKSYLRAARGEESIPSTPESYFGLSEVQPGKTFERQAQPEKGPKKVAVTEVKDVGSEKGAVGVGQGLTSTEALDEALANQP